MACALRGPFFFTKVNVSKVHSTQEAGQQNMIGLLQGMILEKGTDHILLDVNGVGYEVEMPASSLCLLPSVGAFTKLHIHTHVREDALRLFGFTSAFDKKAFLALIQVSGIGPKAALALLGAVDGSELCDIVVNQKLARLVSIPGIGQKTAERIILELKTKFQKLLARKNSLFHMDDDGYRANVETEQQTIEDLKSALSNLGYKEKQFYPMVDTLAQKMKAGEPISFEVAFKETLKKLSEHVLKQ